VKASELRESYLRDVPADGEAAGYEKLMAAEAEIRNAPAPKPSNVNVAGRVAETIIRDLAGFF